MASGRSACRGPSRARFTTLFERLAIDVVRETDMQGATRLLRISWDEAWEIKRRAVARGRARRRAARAGADGGRRDGGGPRARLSDPGM